MEAAVPSSEPLTPIARAILDVSNVEISGLCQLSKLAVVIALSDVSTIFDRFVWWLRFTVERTIIEIGCGQEELAFRFECVGQIAHAFAVIENVLDHLRTDNDVESISKIITLTE